MFFAVETRCVYRFTSSVYFGQIIVAIVQSYGIILAKLQILTLLCIFIYFDNHANSSIVRSSTTDAIKHGFKARLNFF